MYCFGAGLDEGFSRDAGTRMPINLFTTEKRSDNLTRGLGNQATDCPQGWCTTIALTPTLLAWQRQMPHACKRAALHRSKTTRVTPGDLGLGPGFLTLGASFGVTFQDFSDPEVIFTLPDGLVQTGRKFQVSRHLCPRGVSSHGGEEFPANALDPGTQLYVDIYQPI